MKPTLKYKNNINYIFFGTSQFAASVLEYLLKHQWSPALIVTNPPKPQGRKHILSPTPVALVAQAHNLKTETPNNLRDPKFLQTIKDIQPQVAILTAYGKLIPPELLTILKGKFVNLHPSLLPKYRGAIPIQSVILNDEKITGVTIFLMDEQIDHGPIIAQKQYKIINNFITYPELSLKLIELGGELLRQSLPQWLRGEIIAYPQNEVLASYCHKLTSRDEEINWNVSSREVDCKVRALNPQPGIFTTINNKSFKIISGRALSDNNLFLSKQTGEALELNNALAIKCKIGTYLVRQIQPAGKKVMLSQDFLRGNKWIIGQKFNEN